MRRSRLARRSVLFETENPWCTAANGRRSAAGSVNRTEHRSSGSLQPSASVHYGRTDKFLPNLMIKDLTRDSLRDFAGTYFF